MQEDADVENFHTMPGQPFLYGVTLQGSCLLRADDNVLLLKLEEMRLIKIFCVKTCRS